MLRRRQSRTYTVWAVKFIGVIALFLICLTAHAEWELTPSSPIPLYASPDQNSMVLHTLIPANKVLITKPRKIDGDEWVSFNFLEGSDSRLFFAKKLDLKAGKLIYRPGPSKNLGNSLKSNLGVGISFSQNIRAPLASAASGGQTVEYGPQYGIAFYPTFSYEFAATNGHFYRIFSSYRIAKSTGESTISLNGNVSSRELVTQEVSFVSLGLLYRNPPTSKNTFWWGYGMEIAKGMSGKQDYTDGTYVDLKDSLPTNIYAQLSFGYQSFPTHNWQLIPEGKIGMVANNKPFTLNIEAILTMIYGWK